MLTRLAAIAFLLAVSAIAHSQTPAITGFSGGATFGNIDGTDQTVGWAFAPKADVVVSALGVWDSDTADDLQQTHQVGLWTSTGTLLASATVLTNSPLTGSWRYVSIAPVTLQANTTYFVGSAITTPYSDLYTRVPSAGGSVGTSPLIAISSSLSNASAGGFSFPSTVDAIYIGRLGPNLLVVAVPQAVPLSNATLVLLAMGLLLIAVQILRRRVRF